MSLMYSNGKPFAKKLGFSKELGKEKEKEKELSLHLQKEKALTTFY